jgi:hypothetical protein
MSYAVKRRYAPEVIRCKRSATFRMLRTVPFDPFDGWTFSAQARNGALMFDLSVRIIAEAGPDHGVIEISASAAETALWPLLLLQTDFRAARGTEVAHSETFLIDVLEEQTRP